MKREVNAELRIGGGATGAIHRAAGPGLEREAGAELPVKCYRTALALAEENDLESVAFPVVSTGAFGHPEKDAAEVAIQMVIEESAKLKSVRLVRFGLYKWIITGSA